MTAGERVERVVVVGAKVVATAALLPFAMWFPGPEILIARMWGEDAHGE